MIEFITDSTANLPKELIGDYPVKIVSLSVLVDDVLFLENETENCVFYKAMSQAKCFPKTAQPSVELMMNAFEDALKAGNSVIGVFLSSEMSGTFQTACMIKNQFLDIYPDARIEIIDSRTNCMQMGFNVLHGAELARVGTPFEEIVASMQAHVHRSRFIFLPDTLEYLKMGGRIGGAQALLGTIFQILPILTVRDGKTEVLKKVRTKKKAVETMVQYALEEIGTYGIGHMAVHHIDAFDEGKALAEKLESTLGIVVPVVGLGPIIGSHVGPGAIGIAYDLQRPYE